MKHDLHTFQSEKGTSSPLCLRDGSEDSAGQSHFSHIVFSILLCAFIAFSIVARRPNCAVALQSEKASAETKNSDATLATEQPRVPLMSTEYQNRLLLYNLQTRMMQQSWNANDAPQTRFWLEKLRPRDGEEDLRDFSWFYYDRLSNISKGMEHGVRCDRVDISMDGSYLASLVIARQSDPTYSHRPRDMR